MESKKLLKVIDYYTVRTAFDEKFKETRQLIQNGETHLDNLAEGFHEADGVIWSMPTIDAVPVVRCKDCKHGEVDDPEYFPDQYYCHAGCGWNKGDFFCSYGERRGDG